jgi:colicin import membrane protein
MRRILKWLGIGILVLFALAFIGSMNEGGEDDSPRSTPRAESTPKADEGSNSQQQAVRAAEGYLRVMAFSREGLIDQLVFEEYSQEDATYAVDQIDANWNEQAAKAAKAYLDVMPFSRQGLIDQLVFDGFTRSEAEHGVDAVGL